MYMSIVLFGISVIGGLKRSQRPNETIIKSVESSQLIVPTPTLVGREELYTQLGCFLFSQFWLTDIFIVEICEWYH